MSLAVNRVMAEGSLYDPDLAALAIKQARGDLIEAIFLIRAYRTTLPRIGHSEPVDTGAMACDRRISATFKDVPGGQVLGPTFDYTHRLLDFKLAADGEVPETPQAEASSADMPRVTDYLNRDGLIQSEPDSNETPPDMTRLPMEYPANRALRLQALTRATKGSCCRWLIPPSAATPRTTRSWASSASAQWRSRWTFPSWGSPSRSERSR